MAMWQPIVDRQICGAKCLQNNNNNNNNVLPEGTQGMGTFKWRAPYRRVKKSTIESVFAAYGGGVTTSSSSGNEAATQTEVDPELLKQLDEEDAANAQNMKKGKKSSRVSEI